MMRHAVDGKMGRQEKTVPTTIMKTSSSIIRLPITMEPGCVLSRAISGFCEGSNGRTKSEESATSTVSTVRNAILRFTSGVSLSSCSWLVFDCQIASSKLFSTAVMFCEQFWYVVTADGRDSKRRGDEVTRLEMTRLEVARTAAGLLHQHQRRQRQQPQQPQQRRQRRQRQRRQRQRAEAAAAGKQGKGAVVSEPLEASEASLARVCDWGGAVESEQAYSRRTRSLRTRGSQSQG